MDCEALGSGTDTQSRSIVGMKEVVVKNEIAFMKFHGRLVAIPIDETGIRN